MKNIKISKLMDITHIGLGILGAGSIATVVIKKNKK